MCEDRVELGTSIGTVYTGSANDGSNEKFWGETCGFTDGNELLFSWTPPEPGSYRIEVVPNGPSSMGLEQFDDSCSVDCFDPGGCDLAGIGINILAIESDEQWQLVIEGIDADFELQIARDEEIPCEGGTGTGTETETGTDTGTGGEDCPYTNDGECDEPEGTDLCPEGTDPEDCG